MATMLAQIQSLRQELTAAYDRLIAEVAAEPGYSHLTIDALTRERWRIAGASERQSCGVGVGR